MADDCYAIPFVNDTHLANDPARDPDFDDGFPRSVFQEAFSYRVPNLREYGGVFPQARQRGELPRECEKRRPKHRRGGGASDRIHVVRKNAAVRSDGRFAIRLRCPRAAPTACAGKVFVRAGAKRLDARRFRINRRSTADVWLELGRREREQLGRRTSSRVRVVPADRSVVRRASSARVRLSWNPRRALDARLTRAQARRLVAKYRIIAESWNR